MATRSGTPARIMVADAAAAEVVEQPGRDFPLGAVRVDADHATQPGVDARLGPCLAEITDRAADAMKDELGDPHRTIPALELAGRPAALDDRLPVSGLRAGRGDADQVKGGGP